MEQSTASHSAAVTGVYSGSQINWEYMPHDDVDLDYEVAVAELREAGLTDEEIDAELDYYDGGTTRLIGAWEKDNGEYVVFTDGGQEEDFAALYDRNDNYLQVMWSRYIRYGRWASLCFPGQADARNDDPARPDSTHYVPYYAMPPELLV